MTPRGILLFAALGVVWGIPYLFIKIAVTELTPEMLVLARVAIGAVILLPIAAMRRQIIPVLRHWRPLLAYTVVEIVFPFYFINAAEQRLPASTTGLLISTVPLVAIGIGFAMGRKDRLTGWNWTGLAVGTAGVAAVVGLDVAGSDLVGVAQLAVAVVGYALGPAIVSRWMPDLPGTALAALSLSIAAVIYLPFVGITGGWPQAVPSPPVLVSVAVLGVVCSGIAFLLFFALVREMGPVRTTAITYVNPAVAVLAGWLVLGERITVWTIVGFGLVLAGSYLVTTRRPGWRSIRRYSRSAAP